MAYNKYRAKPMFYNGRRYASTMEGEYAIQLDWRIKAGEVTKVEPQVPIELIVNGVLIAKYKIDFKVTLYDGSVQYVEIKGMETPAFKLKWKLAHALYPEYNFIMVKKV